MIWQKQKLCDFDPLAIGLFAFLAILLCLDVITTNRILALGGIEFNPVMTGIASSPMMHAMVKVVFFAGTFCWVKWWNVRVPHAGVYILSALCGWFMVVVVHNLSSLLPYILI